MYYSCLKREHCARSISPLAINATLYVLFPTIITALALPECRLMTRPEAPNKSRLSGVMRKSLQGTQAHQHTHTCTHLVCDRLLRLQTQGSETGVSARVSAERSCMPDAVGLSTQSLGSQPEDHCAYWGGGRWIEMNRYSNPWSHFAGMASAQRLVCDTEQTGVVRWSVRLSWCAAVGTAGNINSQNRAEISFCMSFWDEWIESLRLFIHHLVCVQVLKPAICTITMAVINIYILRITWLLACITWLCSSVSSTENFNVF